MKSMAKVINILVIILVSFFITACALVFAFFGRYWLDKWVSEGDISQIIYYPSVYLVIFLPFILGSLAATLTGGLFGFKSKKKIFFIAFVCWIIFFKALAFANFRPI